MKTITLTPDQMLARWRAIRLLDTSDASGLIAEQPSAIDLILKAEIDAWYRNYLMTAPASLCPVADISATVMRGGSTVQYELILPVNTIRVCRLRLSSWHRDAAIIVDPAPDRKALQTSPFTAAGVHNPIAFHEGLSLYPYPGRGDVETLEVIIHDTSSYTFAEGALADVKPISDLITLS
ncbi:MAG: hypothetical protein K2K55_10685 [Duncaniella sp.]|nr:hypothetical protein [Duncaniella sp.]